MKLSRYILNQKTLIVVLIIALFFAGKLWLNNKKDNKRLTANQTELTSKLQTYQDRNGQLHTEISSLVLSKKELKAVNDSLISKMRNLAKENGKLRKGQNLLYAKLRAKGIGVIKYDTIYKMVLFPLGDTSTIKEFTINDNYLSLQGKAYPDSLFYEYQYTDEIFTNIFPSWKYTAKGKKKFPLCRWFKLGHISVKVDVVTSNKNSKIVNLKSIIIR